jgi:hypothetical protein
LDIQLITLGDQHPDVGTLYTNIGVIYDEILIDESIGKKLKPK